MVAKTAAGGVGDFWKRRRLLVLARILVLIRVLKALPSRKVAVFGT